MCIACFADSPVRDKKNTQPPKGKTAPPPRPPKKAPKPSSNPPSPHPAPHPQWQTCQGIPPRPSPSRSPRQGGWGGVSTRRVKMFLSFFATRGCGGSSTARRPLQRVPPPQRGNMGEVPGGRGTFWCAEGRDVADPKASQKVP